MGVFSQRLAPPNNLTVNARSQPLLNMLKGQLFVLQANTNIH